MSLQQGTASHHQGRKIGEIMDCDCEMDLIDELILYCPLHAAAGELLEKLEKAGRMLNLHVGEFEDPNAVCLELDIENLIAKVKGEKIKGDKI